MMDFEKDIEKQINDSISVKQHVLKNNIREINQAINMIVDAYKKDKKVMWFGNGGSAADSQHLACELVSKFKLQREALRSIALTTNISILTAVSNDYSYENVFERQVEALAEKDDILIGITTSGTSPNVIKAFEKGKQLGTKNIALIGENSDSIKPYAEVILSVPSKDTPRIQESHIMIGHIICELVEKTMFGES
jgi:D-sedoheptulose 7-phosphate isomerase